MVVTNIKCERLLGHLLLNVCAEKDIVFPPDLDISDLHLVNKAVPIILYFPQRKVRPLYIWIIEEPYLHKDNDCGVPSQIIWFHIYRLFSAQISELWSLILHIEIFRNTGIIKNKL